MCLWRGGVNASVNCWKTKKWENWNYIPCNQPGDKLEALISTLTDSLLLARAAISHSSTQIGRYDCKACGTEFSGADLAAAQTQASVANPLYSPINPTTVHTLSGRRCGHVSTPRWSQEQSCAGSMDTRLITDLIKFYLFQEWGHGGCCNNTVFIFLCSKHLVVLWMHIYWTWMALGDHTADSGRVRALNDKLIYTKGVMVMTIWHFMKKICSCWGLRWEINTNQHF